MPVQIQSIVNDKGGMKALDTLGKGLPRIIARSLNRTAERGRTESKRRIMRQVRIRPSDIDAKLTQGGKARNDRLRATLNAVSRPRSLANYVVRVLSGARGVVVSVKRGKVITIRRAFLTKLKGYGGRTDGRFGNVGLAIRLKKGESINSQRWEQNTTKDGRTLLYAPSTQQTFLDNQRNGVAKDISKEFIPNTFEKEFDRNLKRMAIK